MSEEKNKEQAPAIGPYFFSVLLVFLGLWCVYDGWFTTDPEMFRHQTFNRIMALIILPLSFFDIYRTRKQSKQRDTDKMSDKPVRKDASES
ncbi:MAG: hypothetical protein HGA97_09485 [Chlorobiaceae bacterium]|nr:hypothetical protein [Chlorobiaceae bacterium]